MLTEKVTSLIVTKVTFVVTKVCIKFIRKYTTSCMVLNILYIMYF